MSIEYTRKVTTVGGEDPLQFEWDIEETCELCALPEVGWVEIINYLRRPPILLTADDAIDPISHLTVQEQRQGTNMMKNQIHSVKSITRMNKRFLRFDVIKSMNVNDTPYVIWICFSDGKIIDAFCQYIGCVKFF